LLAHLSGFERTLFAFARNAAGLFTQNLPALFLAPLFASRFGTGCGLAGHNSSGPEKKGGQ
jgi:hypothetical protein